MADHRLYLDSVTYREYCLCGAKLVVTSSPPEMARHVRNLFWEQHFGGEHSPATADEARKARARRRKEYAGG